MQHISPELGNFHGIYCKVIYFGKVSYYMKKSAHVWSKIRRLFYSLKLYLSFSTVLLHSRVKRLLKNSYFERRESWDRVSAAATLDSSWRVRIPLSFSIPSRFMSVSSIVGSRMTGRWFRFWPPDGRARARLISAGGQKMDVFFF